MLGIRPLQGEISPILAEFNKTMFHNGKRYVVSQPWKYPQKTKLASNFSQSFFRLLNSCKNNRQKNCMEEGEKYRQIMSEQLEQGILERVQSLGTAEVSSNKHS